MSILISVRLINGLMSRSFLIENVVERNNTYLMDSECDGVRQMGERERGNQESE